MAFGAHYYYSYRCRAYLWLIPGYFDPPISDVEVSHYEMNATYQIIIGNERILIPMRSNSVI